MFKSFIRAASVSLALSAATTAFASPVSIDLSFDGLAINPGERVKIQEPLDSRVVTAGGFTMSSGGDSFLAWCIDLFQTIKSATYTVERPGHVTDGAQENLSRLFTNNYDMAQTTATHSAAFQVAIWEIVYETDAAFDVRNGAFDASHNAPVLNMAQDWLDNLGSEEGTYRLSFYTSGDSQDLVAAAVPLPPGMALMVTGLGLAAFAARRRQTG